jgi:phospholipid/cholesterol/gamma-HCH transport system substrate-binding protein
MLRRNLRFSFDAFDLSASPAHLRTFLRYYFYKGVYLVGGADDYLSRTGTSSSFLGAGIDLTNDDLKVLMSKLAF